MNADEYKKLCHQPNAFSRQDLQITERTLRDANPAIALRLAEILQKSPLPKPEKHKGDKFTDYFLITLSESDAELIVDVFTNLEAGNIETNGTTTPSASIYAGMADKWMSYMLYLDSQKQK